MGPVEHAHVVTGLQSKTTQAQAQQQQQGQGALMAASNTVRITKGSCRYGNAMTLPNCRRLL
jgi:hypothetical protein